MNWKLYIDSPEKRALEHCWGSMDEGDGRGCGWGLGGGSAWGAAAGGWSNGDGRGCGWGLGGGNGWGYGDDNGNGDGTSSEEWK